MGGKSTTIWYSTCACGTQLSNAGSGRPRTVCDSCKANRRKMATYEQNQKRLERMRIYSKMRYARKTRIRTKQKTHLALLREMVKLEKLRRGRCEWPEGCVLPDVCVDTLHAFDFDHRNPNDKSFALSKIRGQSEEKVAQEMAKCDLLCAYHHRIKTQKQREHRLSKVQEVQVTLFDN